MGKSCTQRGPVERLSRFRGGGVIGMEVVASTIGGDTPRWEELGILDDGPTAGWESCSDDSSSWQRFPSTVEPSVGGEGAEGGGVARPESVDEVAPAIITSSPEGNEGRGRKDGLGVFKIRRRDMLIGGGQCQVLLCY